MPLIKCSAGEWKFICHNLYVSAPVVAFPRSSPIPNPPNHVPGKVIAKLLPVFTTSSGWDRGGYR